MSQPDYTKLLNEAEEFLPLLQTVFKELRYGSPTHAQGRYADALVVRFGYFFGWKYQVRKVDGFGREYGSCYFDPTDDGMRACQAYVTVLLKAHHKPIDNPIIQAAQMKLRGEGKAPELYWYVIPRAEPLNMETEVAAHHQRVSELTVEEIKPEEKLS